MFEGSPAATQYIDTLINAKLQGAEIEPDVRKVLHRNLTEMLETEVITAIIDQLNTQQQQELEHLLDTHQEGKLEEYLAKQGINLNQLLAGVMVEFQATYLGA